MRAYADARFLAADHHSFRTPELILIDCCHFDFAVGALRGGVGGFLQMPKVNPGIADVGDGILLANPEINWNTVLISFVATVARHN